MEIKKVIKNESELKEWFVHNYKKLGYTGIVRKDIGKCPDLIMLRDGKEVQVELETSASNFLTHKHPLDKVDEIVCVIKDLELDKPILIIEDLELAQKPNIKVTLSIDEKVYFDFQKYCEDNAIMLSKKIEIFMKDFLKEKKKGGKNG